VIDLVADEPHVVAAAPGRQRGELVGVDHRAGGVGGRCDDEARDRARLGHDRVQHLGPGLESHVRAAVQLHDVAAERAQDVPVGGVSGPGERDAIAVIERRQEREQEGARRARRDRDLLRIHLQPVPARVVGGDRLPQGPDAEGRRVAERLAIRVHAHRAFVYRRRGSARRLARAQRHDVAALRAQLRHAIQDPHHLERRNL